tara:strand:+ start:128 stop:649 length:522 start_codon:yes stop_codon:yes gene_type:complete
MFIYTDNIDSNICKNLIKFYETSNDKEINKTKYTSMTQISVDIHNSFLVSYLKELTAIKDKYVKKYNHLDTGQEPWNLSPTLKIQKYEIGECYNGWHAESTGHLNTTNRLLVFSTFLNTINKGGETEFFYQQQKIKPKEGTTILFPAFWTHTHRGNMAAEIKYLITGWYTYVH